VLSIGLMVLCSVVTGAWGQEPAASPASTAVPAQPSSSTSLPTTAVPATPASQPGSLESLKTQVRYLLNDQGDLVPVPLDAKLEEFLNWLERQQGGVIKPNPVVSVTSLELTGQTNDQLATIEALVRVQVTGAAQPLLFPLGFSEAVLLQEAKVNGPGRVVFRDKDPTQGYRWWFDGNGNYEMRLQLAIPVRRTSPWRRLQLTLPNSPVATLQLNLPEAKPVIKLPEEMVWETQSPDPQTTQIKALGLGTRLDLQWQPTTPVENQQTSFDVNTTLLVRPESRGYVLEATQYVRALQGTFSEFTVRLPDLAELLAAEGSEVRRTRPVPNSPHQFVVELNAPTRGPVIVKWKVLIPQKSAKRWVLKGFEVDQAQTESGEIGLLSPESARWANAEVASRHLERMNAGELRSTLGGAQIVRAYRFYDQPFELPLELQEAVPYFDVRPTLVMYATKDELRLEGRFDIRTFRGQLHELVLIWPGWKSEGWRLEPAPADNGYISSFPVEDPQQESRLQIPIENPPESSFMVRFAAVKAGATSESRISLPRLASSTLARTRVVFLHGENVEAEVIPRGETVLRAASRDESLTPESLGYAAGLVPEVFGLESDERQVTVSVRPQPMQVTVENQTRAAIHDWQLRVAQTLLHDVKYERLATITVAVPAEVAQAVRFSLDDRELQPQWSAGEDAGVRWAELTLPSPRLGPVSLLATWEQPLPLDLRSEQDAAVVLPVLKSLSGELTGQTFEFARPAWYEVSAVDSAWQLVHQTSTSSRWIGNVAAEVFTGLIVPTTGEDGAEFIAQRAWISVMNDRTGLQQYRAQIRLSGSAPGLNVQLPATALIAQFYRDGEPIPESQIIESPTGSRRYTLAWSTNSNQPVVRHLTVEYTVKQPPTTGLTAVVTTEAPTFPQVRWASRVLWQIQVPSDQHAFRLPENAVPLYVWLREGLVWQRQPQLTIEQLQSWVGGPTPAFTERLLTTGHEYTFSQFGPIDNLRIRTLSSAMLFVCGAGSTLLIGFLIIKLPLMRSLLAVLLMLSLMMLATLWYLPELELLLQPMLVGALLASLLGCQEYFSRGRQRGTILTLSGTPSELRLDPREGSATHSLLVRSHDSATVFRSPPSEEESQGRVPVESHAG